MTDAIDRSKAAAARLEEERLERKRKLAAAYRLFSRLGFDEGVAGHITARDPEHAERFWLSPFGLHFAHVRVSDLVLIDAEGTVVSGESTLVNRAAFAIHSQVHAARPDVTAVAHAHSTYGRAFAALGRKLDPITQDACAFYGDHALFADYTGVVLEPKEGRRIAASLGGHKAVILRNHGLLTVGGSVDEAAWWFVAMERACQVQLLAEGAGAPHLIDHEMAEVTRDQVGSQLSGWFSFQPLYESIVKEQPELLE